MVPRRRRVGGDGGDGDDDDDDDGAAVRLESKSCMSDISATCSHLNNLTPPYTILLININVRKIELIFG